MNIPSYICQKHWQEWHNSSVDQEIIALNVRSDVDPFSWLYYGLPTSERRNDGRLRDRWVEKGNRFERNWAVKGIDVLSVGCSEPSEWCALKPDNPIFDKQKQKHRKYEHPPKVPTEIFALQISVKNWKCIADRSGVEMPSAVESISFWQWVIENPSISLVITEGAKKAGALLTAGYAAIALPGIYSGYRQPRDEEGNPTGLAHLIPQLEVFAASGRKIYFAFDNDSNQKTRANVQKAIAKTGWLFSQKECKSFVIEWEGYLEKGCDDLITAHGVTVFHRAFNQAESLVNWQAKQYSQLTYPISFRHDDKQKYLGNFSAPASEKLICLKSPKDTGKTEWLANQISQAVDIGQKVLVLTHRRQLGMALCDRFGISYIEEISSSPKKKDSKKSIFGFGLCVDSLHQHSLAHFNPEEWEGALIIIDECEQVFWHLLNANTEVKKHRVAVLRNLKTVIQNSLGEGSGKVFLSDADLSDVSIDFVKSLAGYPVKPWILLHEYKNPVDCYDCYTFGGKDPSLLVAQLVSQIKEGEIPFVCLSGQKAKSKWGTQNLEAYLQKLFPEKKILRIDSESISDPMDVACGCIEKLNQILPDYDIVLASPAIETGVSIDIRGHFTSVWGIAQGVQTENSVRQALKRVRENIPRYLWIAEKGLSKIGNGSTSIKSLLASQHQAVKTNISLLAQTELTDGLEVNFQPQALTTWAKFAVRINYSMCAYKNTITSGLAKEGQRITPFTSEIADAGEVKNEVEETRDEGYKSLCDAVANSKNPTDKDFKELQDKRGLNKDERLALRHGSLARRYEVEVTPELVEKDDEGWYSKLRLHYYLSVGREYLQQCDRKSAEAQIQRGGGAIWIPDFSRSQWSAAVALLDYLGIPQLLNPELELVGVNPLLREIEEKAKKEAWAVKTLLGVSIHQKDTPIAIAQNILFSKLDLRMEYLGRLGTREDRRRMYKGATVKDNRMEIFERWLERDRLAAEDVAATAAGVAQVPVSTPSNNKEYTGWADTSIGESSLDDLSGVPVESDPTEGGEQSNPVWELVEAFKFCELPHQFAAVIEGYAAEVVEDAIALADSQPRRKQLADWYQQLSQGLVSGGGELAHEGEALVNPDWKQKISGYAELLQDALKYGIDVIKPLLEPWAEDERRGAILELQKRSPQSMARLIQLEPNWSHLCAGS